ncbi:MAG: ATP-binding protein, partial [Pseudomonadota bacterium]
RTLAGRSADHGAQPWPANRGSRLPRWLLAAGALAVAIAIQHYGGSPFLFVPALVLAAWLLGLWGGLLATALACAAAYAVGAVLPLGAAELALAGIAISALGDVFRRDRETAARKRQEAATRLDTSESLWARAQRIAHMGSWELDIATGHLAWSDEIYRIFGIGQDAAPVTLDRFVAYVHPDDLASLQQAQDQSLRDKAPLDIEHRIVRADGEVRWVHELGEVHLDDRGRVDRLTGTVRDITERKHARLQLQEAKETLEQTVAERTAQLQAALARAEAADRVKSAFLATMSHELRTPLNSIIGFTGILLQSLAGPLNAEQAKQLGMVRGSARHLLELINDVLDISRIEAGQLEIHPAPLDLALLVERVMASVGPQAAAKKLTLETVLPAAPLGMVGDRRRIEQVLLNLVSNAIKFTERGSVTLTVDAPASAAEAGTPQLIRMHVADSGIGISDDDLRDLFLPFRQVDSGLTRSHEGTGLGLAICSRLVALMGGSISVASAPGKGSTFSVTLPASGASNP